MTEPSPEKPFDPFAMWREAVSKFESQANSSLNSAMGSEEFAQFMGKATGLSLGLQNAVNDLMGRYLKALNLPSREDINALGERLQGIEDTLARLADTQEQLERRSASRAEVTALRPAKTRQPPTPAGGQ